MKNDLQLGAIGDKLGSFFQRYHLLLFFLVIAIGLGVSLLTVIQITNISQPSAAQTPINNEFDKATIDRINSIGGSSQSSVDIVRESPFTEQP